MKQKLILTKDYELLVDLEAKINYEKDLVHASDTSLFNGFQAGKISEGVASSARKWAGFEFIKIIAYKKLNDQAKDLDLPIISIDQRKVIKEEAKEYIIKYGTDK